LVASILLALIGFGWLVLGGMSASKPPDKGDVTIGLMALMIHLAGVLGLLFHAFK
jgi:hypothetical protein